MRKIVKLLFLSLLFLSLSWAIFHRMFEPIDLVGYDLALQLRTKLNPADTRDLPLVFIPIDDATLRSKEFRQFPIPRDRYAVVLDALREWGAKQVVFDILFSEPSFNNRNSVSMSQNPDDVFLSAIVRFEKNGDVLLPYGFATDPMGQKRFLPVYYPFAEAIREQTKIKTGFINAKEDIDGKMRFLIVREKTKNRMIYRYHMALVSVLNHLGVRSRDVHDNSDSIEFVVLNGKKVIKVKQIPLYLGNRLYLDYPGKWYDCFNKVSFGEVYHYGAGLQEIKLGHISKDSEEGKEILRHSEEIKRLVQGRTCIIGLTASGTQDLRPTPIETSSPMVSVYGVVFSQVWYDRYIRRMCSWISVIVFLLLTIVAIVPTRSLARLWIIYTIPALAWVVVAVLLFVYEGWWFDYLSPVLGSVVFVMGSSIRLYLETVREREKAEQEMKLASDIQSHMLPKDLPKTDTFSVEVFFSPAVFVAGDFYDVWMQRKEKVRVLMGDVSGKGVSAALYVAQVITAERVLRARFENRDISELMEGINRFLSMFKISGIYATACMLDLLPDKIIVSDAGHLSIWIYRAEEKAIDEVKLNTGAPLGVDRWSEYKSVEVNWQTGDVVMVFSDGLIEARVGEKFIDEDAVKSWIVEHISESQAKIDVLMSSFYGKHPQSDDITFLLIRNSGVASDGIEC